MHRRAGCTPRGKIGSKQARLVAAMIAAKHGAEKVSCQLVEEVKGFSRRYCQGRVRMTRASQAHKMQHSMLCPWARHVYMSVEPRTEET